MRLLLLGDVVGAARGAILFQELSWVSKRYWSVRNFSKTQILDRIQILLSMDLQSRLYSWAVVASTESLGQKGSEHVCWGGSLCGAMSGMIECACTHPLIPSHPECTEPVILHIPVPSSCSNGRLEPAENYFKSAECVIRGRRSTKRPSLALGSSLSPC